VGALLAAAAGAAGIVCRRGITHHICAHLGIPTELTDAAHIGGCGEIRTLVQIVLPLSKPILATLTLIYAVGTWNNWFGPAIYLSDQSKYPITLTLRNLMQEAAGNNVPALSVLGNLPNITNLQAITYTLTIVVILPILLIYRFVQRYLMQGLLVGSLKG
jgi:putative aldouronate transport system permease protein